LCSAIVLSSKILTKSIQVVDVYMAIETLPQNKLLVAGEDR